MHGFACSATACRSCSRAMQHNRTIWRALLTLFNPTRLRLPLCAVQFLKFSFAAVMIQSCVPGVAALGIGGFFSVLAAIVFATALLSFSCAWHAARRPRADAAAAIGAPKKAPPLPWALVLTGAHGVNSVAMAWHRSRSIRGNARAAPVGSEQPPAA